MYMLLVLSFFVARCYGRATTGENIQKIGGWASIRQSIFT